MNEGTLGHLIRWNHELNRREILLGKRKTSEFNGTLSGPGGKKEPGESILECLVREFREEVGVEIYKGSALHVATIDYHRPTDRGNELFWRVHYFNITEWHGVPKPMDGFESVDWYPLENMPYSEMHPDVKHWFPRLLLGKGHNLLKGNVFYMDKDRSIVGSANFDFVSRPNTSNA